jgi:hypothetical protein
MPQPSAPKQEQELHDLIKGRTCTFLPLVECDEWEGQPNGLEGQAIVWATAEEVRLTTTNIHRPNLGDAISMIASLPVFNAVLPLFLDEDLSHVPAAGGVRADTSRRATCA